jgi:hypothetical protein
MISKRDKESKSRRRQRSYPCAISSSSLIVIVKSKYSEGEYKAELHNSHPEIILLARCGDSTVMNWVSVKVLWFL